MELIEEGFMRRLDPEVEREVRRLAAKGHRLREIGRMLGCSRHAVTNTLLRAPRAAAPAAWNPSPTGLSIREREKIRVGLERGDTFTVIANKIGRAVSTVSREVKANGGRDGYRAHVAHQGAFERARRPKTPKLACPRLAAKVAEGLEHWWSSSPG
jgi:IS30 family transposase